MKLQTDSFSKNSQISNFMKIGPA